MAEPAASALIAVVDDDERMLRSLEVLLESAECDVRAFASGTAFVESGCLGEIDCLISDIAMPVMDGFELLRMARDARPDLPVILVSGRSDVLDRVPSPASGHYRVFEKPFDAEKLLAAVADAVRKTNLPPLQ